jgi:MarR family transcriptional regulator for hemolysin
MNIIGKQINILVRQFNLYLNHELTGLNVSATEILYLASLYKEDGLTQDELASEYVVDKAAVARTVSKMEDKGLITRKDNPKNRRQKQLFLTEKARKIKPELKKVQDRWLKIMTEDEDAGLTEALSSYLDRIVNRAISVNQKEAE